MNSKYYRNMKFNIWSNGNTYRSYFKNQNEKKIEIEKSNGNPLGANLTGNTKTKFKCGSEFICNSSSNKVLKQYFF